MGGMDISEKRKPQDGRITHFVDGVEYDIRVSILPTVHGEKTVMRLAEKKQLKREIHGQRLSLSDHAPPKKQNGKDLKYSHISIVCSLLRNFRH